MLAAIPGYAHLRVFIPDEPERGPETDETAIDVLHRYPPGAAKSSGPVAVKSLHTRPSSTETDSWELFGTALIGAAHARRSYGFTAVCSGEQLVSLRVLSG